PRPRLLRLALQSGGVHPGGLHPEPAAAGAVGRNERSEIMATAKEELRHLLEQLPDDVSLEQIQYHIYVKQKVQRSLDAAGRGEILSQDEVEARMEKWLGR